MYYYQSIQKTKYRTGMGGTAIVLLLILLCSSSHSTTGESLHHTFWVTPSTEQGCGDRTPCDTIDGYGQNKSIFSTSNATWIFMQGEHQVNVDFTINSAIHVALTAEEQPLIIFNNSFLKIEDSRDITIQWLTVEGYVHILNVTNLVIYNSTFRKPPRNSDFDETGNSLTYCQNPRGLYLVQDSYIEELFTYIYTSSYYQVLSKPYHINMTFQNVTFNETFLYSFESESVEKYDKGNVIVNVDRCTLNSNTNFLFVSFTENLHVAVTNSLVRKNLKFRLRALPVFESGIIPNVSVGIAHCNFSGETLYNRTSLLLFYVYGVQSGDYKYYPQLLPNITIEESDFQRTAVIVMNLAWLSDQLADYYTFQFKQCTFKDYQFNEWNNGYVNNKANVHVKYNYAIIVSGVWFPVILSNCNITDNNGGAIFLSQGTLLLRGHILIENNHISNIDGNNSYMGHSSIVCIVGDSSLLVEKDTKLEIKNNIGAVFGGIVFPHLKRLYGSFYAIHYHPLKPICPKDTGMDEYDGRNTCFFQPISQKGKPVKTEDITDFNWPIVLGNNSGLKNSLQLFNGRLLNCILKTEEGLLASNQSLLQQFIHLPHWSSNYVSSLPYVCICNEADLSNSSLWNCDPVSSITVRPGRRIQLYVTIVWDPFVGNVHDFDHKIKEVLILYDHIVHKYQFTMKDQKCIKAVDIEYKELHSNLILIQLEVFWPVGKRVPLYSTHHLHVVRCPLGLTKSMTSMSCNCSGFLKSHNFQCSSTSCNIAYFKQIKASYSLRYWIGLKDDKLVLADNCPQFYCNEKIKSEGVILEFWGNHTKSSIQCNEETRRTGLFCNECPSGYGSVLGGFTCTDCTGYWYLFTIPWYIFSSIVLLAILFLFNLTVVQGTITGIIFYGNIMYLYADVIRQHAGVPLYNLIQFVNNEGFSEMCLFPNMDEFTKHLFLFLYPLYLLLIVVIIIIGAHKFNLRIFKVEFIAKRAVPVLATLMVLTYTHLLKLVFHSLRYTHIYSYYDSEYTGQKTGFTKGWFYQPSIEYFQGKHLVLGLLAIAVTVLYLIPLTAITLFGDLLRRNCIRSLWFSHFLDVFHGAYRWPLGFWLGVRMSLRVILILLQLVDSFHLQTFAFTFVCILYFLQVHVVRPFHSRSIHSNHSADANKKNIIIRTVAQTLKWFMNPANSDSLFLVNIIFLIGFINSNIQDRISLRMGLSALLISAAIVQVFIITLGHAWMYFPVPRCIKKKMNSKFNRTNVPEPQRELSFNGNIFERLPPGDVHHFATRSFMDGESARSADQQQNSECHEDQPQDFKEHSRLTEPLLNIN